MDALQLYGRVRLPLITVLAVTGGIALQAEQQPSGATSLAESALSSVLDVVQLTPNFHVIATPTGNVTIQSGPDGVVVVDSGSLESAKAVLVEIRKISSTPIRYIINTNAHHDHVAANGPISAAGRPLANVAGGGIAGGGGARPPSAGIVSHENVLLRMTLSEKPKYEDLALPSENFLDNKNIYLNNEGIDVIHQPAASDDGHSFVFFRRSDVVVAGDVFNTDRFPVIDVARGGTIQGAIDALNNLLKITIPSIPQPWKDGGTLVVPGHGFIGEEADVVEYRDAVTIIRDVVQGMVNKGMTLEQVLAAEPTHGYTRRYGSTDGPWTTRMFVEAVYKTLPKKAGN